MADLALARRVDTIRRSFDPGSSYSTVNSSTQTHRQLITTALNRNGSDDNGGCRNSAKKNPCHSRNPRVNQRGPNRLTHTATNDTSTKVSRPSTRCSAVTTPRVTPMTAITGAASAVCVMVRRRASRIPVDISMAMTAPSSTTSAAGWPSTVARPVINSAVDATATSARMPSRSRAQPGSEAMKRSRASRSSSRSRRVPAAGDVRPLCGGLIGDEGGVGTHHCLPGGISTARTARSSPP